MCDNICKASCEALQRKRTRYNTVGRLSENEERALYLMWQLGEWPSIPYTNDAPTWERQLDALQRRVWYRVNVA